MFDALKESAMSESDTLHILDIDLDAFQSDTEHYKSGKRRLSAKRYVPWADDQLRQFLETKCGLSRGSRIPGRYRTEHDGALEFFEGLHDQDGRLLHVAHLDGHADLGLGDPSWVHVIREWLAKSPSDRRRPPHGRKFCNPGSYLAYAAAERLLASITYAYPPGGGSDFPTVYFLDNNPLSGFLQLKHFESFGTMDYEELTADQAISVEPLIPFRASPISEYQAPEPFDAAFVCQSPGFTSKKADSLLYVLAEYVCFDDRSDPLPESQAR